MEVKMDIGFELQNFIEQKEHSGALLITGKWGSGKSYYIKNWAQKINSEEEHLVIIISLFGIDTAQELHQRVKEEYISATSSPLQKAGRRIKNKSKDTIAKGVDVIASVFSHPIVTAISKGISSVISLDFWKLVSVKNTACIQGKNRSVVLVFDDLERNKIEMPILLGAINEYCENRLMKTIIIANDEEIFESEKDNFQTFKEKIISRTIRHTPRSYQIIQALIENYQTNIDAYKDFLRNNISILQKVFEESNCENIRNVKSILADFERAFAIWTMAEAKTEKMHFALYTFAVVKIEYSQNNVRINRYGLIDFEEKNTSQKYSLYESNAFHRLDSLTKWVVTGEWDQDNFKTEIERKYSAKPMSNEQKFLEIGIPQLEYSIVADALPSLLEKFYNASLSCREMCRVLEAIDFMEASDIPLPVSVDFDQILMVLDDLEKRIRQGEIPFDWNSVIARETHVNPQITQCIEKIGNIGICLTPWENYRTLCEYFAGKKNGPYHEFCGKHIDIFDQHMLDLFWNTYQRADTKKRTELASVLASTCRSSRYFLQAELKSNLEVDISNYRALISMLLDAAKAEKDPIKAYNMREFANTLNNALGIDAV